MTTDGQVLASLRTAIKACTDSVIDTDSDVTAEVLAHATLQLAEAYRIVSDTESRKQS